MSAHQSETSKPIKSTFGPDDTPLYASLQWGYGAGVLHCQICGALVLPEPAALVDRHAAWHADIGDQARQEPAEQ